MSEIGIIKQKRKHSFTMVPNDLMLNSALSLRARGVHAILLGLPENWSLNAKWLQDVIGLSRNTTYNLLNELIRAGYISRERLRDDNGHLTGQTNYLIYDSPIDNPYFTSTVTTNKTHENPVVPNFGTMDIPVVPNFGITAPVVPNFGTLNNTNTLKDNYINNTHTTENAFKSVWSKKATQKDREVCVIFLERFLDEWDTKREDAISDENIHLLSTVFTHWKSRTLKILNKSSYARKIRKDVPSNKSDTIDFIEGIRDELELIKSDILMVNQWECMQKDLEDQINAKNDRVSKDRTGAENPIKRIKFNIFEK